MTSRLKMRRAPRIGIFIQMGFQSNSIVFLIASGIGGLSKKKLNSFDTTLELFRIGNES